MEMEKEQTKAESKKKQPTKVKIKLPLTRTEKNDVWVCLNGKSYLIKRGVEVEVPYGVAKILEHREKMLGVALDYQEELDQKRAAMEKL